MGLKTSIEQEKVVFAYMLKRPQYLLHVEKDFFSNDDIQYVANSAKQFFKEYKEAPSCEQMKAILKDDKKDIKNETVDSIYNVDIVSMDEEWLKDTTEAWLKWRSFNTNFMKAAMLAKTTDVSLDNVRYFKETIEKKEIDVNDIKKLMSVMELTPKNKIVKKFINWAVKNNLEFFFQYDTAEEVLIDFEKSLK